MACRRQSSQTIKDANAQFVHSEGGVIARLAGEGEINKS